MRDIDTISKLTGAHLNLVHKAAELLGEEVGAERYCWIVLEALGVPAHKIPDDREGLAAKMSEMMGSIMAGGLSDEAFFGMLQAFHREGGPRVKQIIEAEGSVVAKLHEAIFSKKLIVDGEERTVKMPYESHCDECSEHDRRDDRVGWCKLFDSRPLVCECGAPARLVECRAAEEVAKAMEYGGKAGS